MEPEHILFVYRNQDEFSQTVSGFVREGVSKGDRALIMLEPSKQERTREQLGAAASSVRFLPPEASYHPQAVTTVSLIEHLRENDTHPTRVVIEHPLAARGPLQVKDYLRMEAAANLVFAPYSVSILCPYDASTLSPDVIEDGRRTHSHTYSSQGFDACVDYDDPRKFVAEGRTVVKPPAHAEVVECASPKELAASRGFVFSRAVRVGIPNDRAQDLELGLTETLTNALLHGKPPFRVYTYEDDGWFVVHVHDGGGGLEDPLAGYLPPSTDSINGRGLWLTRQLCDVLEIATDETGTHVRVLTVLPGKA